MKKTGLLILLVVLILCMVAFAACGNKADPDQPDDNPPDEQVHTHIFGDPIAEVAATCEADGVKAHKHCLGCNKDFDAEGNELTDLVIPKLGHQLEAVTEVAATCAAEGTKAHQKCATCGKLFDAEGKEVTEESLKIEKLTEHTNIVSVDEEAQTCAKVGMKAHKECKDCGQLFDLNGNETTAEALAIAKDEHDFGPWIAEVPASYGVDGMKAHYQCSFCKNYFDKNKKEIAEADLVLKAVKTSEGLEFTSNGDETCSVTGMGTCTDTEVVIPAVSPAGDKVIEIGKDAFMEKDIKSVTIPASVSFITPGAFAVCGSLEELIVDEGNENYYSDRNCIIETATSTLVVGCKGSVIPTDGTVTAIGDYAFLTCPTLESIYIPGCITSIGEYAFAYCEALEEIDFVGFEADWNNITNGNSTWKEGTPANLVVKTAKDGVYSQGLSFDEITGTISKGSCEDKILIIPAAVPAEYQPNPETTTTVSVTKIAKEAFKSLTKTTIIVIPAKVTEIGETPFKGCTNLATVQFLGSVERWREAIKTAGDWRTAVNKVICSDHTLIYNQAKSATATADGNIEYWECEACGKYFRHADMTEITEEGTVAHYLTKVDAKEATAMADGNIEYWKCEACSDKYFSDAEGTTEITLADTVTHKLTKVDAKEATTEAAGNIEYWYCEACGACFSDEAGTTEITQAQTVLPKLGS